MGGGTCNNLLCFAEKGQRWLIHWRLLSGCGCKRSFVFSKSRSRASLRCTRCYRYYTPKSPRSSVMSPTDGIASMGKAWVGTSRYYLPGIGHKMNIDHNNTMASGNTGRAQSVMMAFVYLILLFRTDGHLEGSLKHDLLHNGVEFGSCGCGTHMLRCPRGGASRSLPL